MFVEHETEREYLIALWRKGTAMLVACRERRRVGKSRLVNKFSRRTGEAYIKPVGLPPRPDMSVRHVLVYLGQLNASVEGGGFFDTIIPTQRLLKQTMGQHNRIARNQYATSSH